METFRELRKRKLLKQDYVLNYLKENGVVQSRSTLSAKENGKIKFSARECQLLCTLYDVGIEYVDLR